MAGYKRKRPTYKKKSTKKPVKRIVMKETETKKKPVSWNKVEMLHNVLSSTQMLHINQASLMPTTGTTQQTRIGDRIDILGRKIRLLSAAPYTVVFEAVTNNVLLDDPNKETTKVLVSGYIRSNQGGLTATGNDEYTFCKRLFIPHKKTYKFGPDDNAVTHNQPISC